MPKSQTERRVSLLFYLLTAYILLQFAWWAYLLIDLNRTLYASSGEGVIRLKTWMIIGEGSVFLIFLLAGIFIMQRTIRKEIALVRQQRNFLLSITHELKTPIASIKLGLQTLQKRKSLSPEERKPFEESAIKNTERLHSLIDNVLLATRIESGQRPLPFLQSL
jgi:signal transduction histidine kinase